LFDGFRGLVPGEIGDTRAGIRSQKTSLGYEGFQTGIDIGP
jgi:hypothetical protein